MTTEELLKKVIDICEDVKAQDLKVYEMENNTLADFNVICTGNSDPHIRAISDRIIIELKKVLDEGTVKVDGNNRTRWIVMDLGNIIVHIFHPETREFYNIEKVWQDGSKSPESLPWECDDREILEDQFDFRRF